MKQKPRVTTVVKDASILGGGILAVAAPLYMTLKGRGLSYSFISGSTPYEQLDDSWSVGLLGIGALFLPRDTLGDVVHIHGIWTPFELFCFLVGKIRKKKVVVSPHGALEPWAFNSKGFKKKLAWYLYQKKVLVSSDLLIVNSCQERDNLRALGLKGPIAVIPNGVDLDGYNKHAACRNERPKVLLYFSRLDKKKGIDLLLRAWGRVENKNDFILRIQGYGDKAYKYNLLELVNQLKLNECVEFVEPKYGRDRWGAFADASIYILPSYSENFGITVAEALMSGLPSITTTEMPWQDLTLKKIGWSVRCDEEAIIAALNEAINLDEHTLLQMRSHSIEYAKKRFLWKYIAKEYEQAYQWMLQPSENTMPKSIAEASN
ncbi:glycosyltransferase [Vibrio sinaloensis]|uniref:glycosyltransferase n=1 Tax=Photobacterium sp. (strain ATCC 43367) TaxID=379097 RepID=UPI0022B0684B|nr:glycosyltransferase [Vibrio sinaloensis]MCZ4294805.1 glycosyltransferase [Vibrio sinaloensis]